MTVKAFANFLGISSSTLFTWENGAIPRDPECFKIISRKLELPLHFLIFGEEEPDYLNRCKNHLS